jgi:diguanylate cyclase (GGDEF)-like protein
MTELDALVPLGRRGLIQATNIFLTILVASLAVVKIAILGIDSLPIPALFVVIAGLSNSIYIRLHGSLDIAAWILVISALLGFAFSSVYTGGFNAPVVLLAPIIPIMTVLLINKRAAWISLGLVCSILACLFVLGVYGYVPENTIDPSLVMFGRYIVLTSLCLISTWVVSRFASISRTLLVQLEKQSNIDYLTGILNRRAIEARLLQEVARANRSDTWLSFIMADVDFFKLYNDSNGHQAGDNCLKDIATLIDACCERPTDVVGRFGGEEFVLILPDTDNDGALRIAENLRNTLLDKNIHYGPENTNPVTLTLGIVSAKGLAIDDVENLIRDADEALYKGKDQGRNCVVNTVYDNPKVTYENQPHLKN